MKSLVVEDDFLARALLLTILSEYGECHVAVNGEEAVRAVQSALEQNLPYDAMCLDILMPVLDGQKALLEIRKVERSHGIKETQGIKVIMVTALEDFENIVQAFESGHCEAYLTKPLNREKLLDHLFELELIEHDELTGKQEALN
jgi:two-component system chemotaxis response regulator CheY